MLWTWRRDISFSVLTSSRTEAERHEDLGCSIQGPASRRVRQAHLPLKRAAAELGAAEAIKNAKRLVQWLEETPRYRALTSGMRRRAGRLPLRDDVLFPSPKRTPPRVLHVRRGEVYLDVPVPPGAWPQLADFVAAVSAGLSLKELPRSGWLGSVVAELKEGDAFERATAPLPIPASSVRFVGHNTFLVGGKRARVLVDPYFRPASDFDLPSYQPVQARDLGQVEAVVITHSHGDHFHLGSLLTLPRTTKIFVPHVERESLFSTDCVFRLKQLGFENVEPLRWGDSREVGDLRIEAMPFYGEQPTVGEGVYPGLFNQGNTWRIVSESQSCAFFADAGADVRGDMSKVCREMPRTDFFFCGIRGFRLRPIHYGFTTLDAFLVNVPLEHLTMPVQLMADPEEALEYARLLRAREVIPCADGGAPWYWREGMGPRYPGFPGMPVPGASRLDENPDADPFPERLQEAAAQVRSPVHPRILRPGDLLTLSGRPRTSRAAPFAWPFTPKGSARKRD